MRVYFNKRRGSPISNMSPHPVQAWGRTFRTAEHAYQFRKCVRLGYTRLAEQVLRADTPMKAKRIGARVPQAAKRRWQQGSRALKCMLTVLVNKYNQVPLFRYILQANPTAHFLEETRDTWWGIGGQEQELNNVSLQRLPGKNWLGKLVMLVARYKSGIRLPELLDLWTYDEQH